MGGDILKHSGIPESTSEIFLAIVALEFLRQVQDVLEGLVGLLVVLLELLVLDQRPRLLLDFPNGVEANQDQYQID